MLVIAGVTREGCGGEAESPGYELGDAMAEPAGAVKRGSQIIHLVPDVFLTCSYLGSQGRDP